MGLGGFFKPMKTVKYHSTQRTAVTWVIPSMVFYPIPNVAIDSNP
jgi:hypothetical protein